MATAEAQPLPPPLPLEIIREILAWLPVKSVGRFRCVKKSWNSLTHEPRFIKLHYDKATQNDNTLHQRRRIFVSDMWMLFLADLDERLNRIDLDDDDHPTNKRVAVKKTWSLDFMGFAIHSNGLLFMRSCHHDFSVVNPVTNETRVLACPPTYDMFTDEVCGFGFDEIGMEHKVVHGHFCDDELRISVYGLRGDAWRVVGKLYPYKRRTSGMEGSVVNGGVHWLVRGVSSGMVIVCFGLAEEGVVREIELPKEFNVVEGEDDYYLSVFEGCLCVGKKDDVVLWVMKEYGVVKSWTKMIMTAPFSERLLSGFVRKNHHLLLLRDGMRMRLAMHDFRKRTFRAVLIRGVDEPCSVGFYVESLVSPNKYQV